MKIELTGKERIQDAMLLETVKVSLDSYLESIKSKDAELYHTLTTECEEILIVGGSIELAFKLKGYEEPMMITDDNNLYDTDSLLTVEHEILSNNR